jgi:hypothetical protein
MVSSAFARGSKTMTIAAMLLLLVQPVAAETGEPVAGMAAEDSGAAAPAAPAEDAEEREVRKPRKVCRMVSDPRVSPLLSRRKVCREVFDEDEQV